MLRSILSFIALSFGLALVGCKRLPIEMQLLVDQKPLPGVEVTVLGRTAITDEAGRIPIIKSSKKELRRLQAITAKSTLLGIDSTYTMKLVPRRINVVHARAGSNALLAYYTKLRQQQDDIDSFEDQLSMADSILRRLEREVKTYMEKHPNSAMNDFILLINNRRAELKELEKTVSNIKKTYADAITKLEGGKFSKKNFDELQGLYEQTENDINDYNTWLTGTAEGVRNNIDSRPEMEYKTDVFFNPGKFRIDNLSVAGQQDLKLFYQKVLDYIEKYYPNNNKTELIISIKVVGYTDGVAVGNDLWADISRQCESNSPRGDGNNCLSELRAKSLSDYFAGVFAAMNPKIDYDGLGSAGATPNINDSQKRRCVASFAIYTKEESTRHKIGKQ